jgi:hypothetical protein
MKKLQLLVLLITILSTNVTFSQIRKAGNYYELNDLWKRDSVSVKQLLNKFDLKISKLDSVQFFKQFDFNLELHDNYSYKTYVYVLYKKTGEVTMESFNYEGNLPQPNKYVMVYCFDDYVDKKIINIKVF